MRLIIDTDRRELLPFAFGLTGTVSPDFRQGDTEPLEIVLVRGSGSGGGLEAVDYGASGWLARVAIGQLEEKPITGTFRLSYAGQATPPLPVNATAEQIRDNLNSLGTINAAGNVTVEVVAGTDGQPGASFLITFNFNGARSQITADADNLFPRSATVAIEAVTGDATTRSSQLIRFTRSPAALATSFSALPAATSSVSSIYAWDGHRSITRVKFLNVLGGSFILTWYKHGSGSYSAAVPYNISAAGLEAIVSTFDNLTNLVSVSQVGFRTFDITVEHNHGSTGVNGFVVNSTPAIKVPGYSGNISLATVEVEEMLSGETSTPATLEVSLEKAGEETTVLQTNATVRNDLFEQTPASPIEFDVPLGKDEAAALYLSKAGNLDGIGDAPTARANLGIVTATDSTAGLVELANIGEASIGVDATRAASPFNVIINRATPGFGLLPGASSIGLVSGVGAASNSSMFGVTVLSPDPGVVGYATRRFQANNGQVGSLGARDWGIINFSSRIIVSFRIAPLLVSTAGTVSNDSVINANYGTLLGTDNGGALARKGFGIRISGENPLQLAVHNGTSLSYVNSTFTQPKSTTATTSDFLIISENGTVTLFHRTEAAPGWFQIATSSEGPTGISGANAMSFDFSARNESVSVTSSRWRFLAGFLSISY